MKFRSESTGFRAKTREINSVIELVANFIGGGYREVTSDFKNLHFIDDDKTG